MHDKRLYKKYLHNCCCENTKKRFTTEETDENTGEFSFDSLVILLRVL